MSKSKKNEHVRWHRMAPARLAGYLAPFIIFVLTVMWLKPQNQLGWIGAAIPFVTALFMISIPTFKQARREINRKVYPPVINDELTIFQWETEPGFKDPEGATSMDQFLERQP